MRVSAFIDGFNLYFSLLELGDEALKWIDLWALVSNYLDENDCLEAVYYFSALLKHHPNKKHRHQEYIHALESRGVQVILGQFKKKRLLCKNCEEFYYTYEEKQSDVNLAIWMLEQAFLNTCDKMILVSADTDFASTIWKIRALFPNKTVILLAPPKRFNICHALREAAHISLEIKKSTIKEVLFPESFRTENLATPLSP
ncbi:NYN domain-containing protein [Helicobacter salomonis]|uniref:NYN domain-containing protein n=1 Tax=Helicobacter salomonis TaxID=56878 RepID=UPI00131522FF|nr:NYN domain-containing protein [Helicobacter salomonis]